MLKPQKNIKTFKVLIIDNTERDIISLREAIKNDDFFGECEHVRVFGEAKLLINQYDFNVIICDYNMPTEGNYSNGLDYLLELRKENPDIFLCLYSGHATIRTNKKVIDKTRENKIFPCLKTNSDQDLVLNKIKVRLINTDLKSSKIGEIKRGKDSNPYSLPSSDVIIRYSKATHETLGRIVTFDKEYVYVDCVLNSDEKIIEHRKFPIFLFEKLTSIKENLYIKIILIKEPGFSQIRIQGCQEEIDESIFSIEHKWEQLRDGNLDEKMF